MHIQTPYTVCELPQPPNLAFQVFNIEATALDHSNPELDGLVRVGRDFPFKQPTALVFTP
jgi:hypothetical protein